jgi:hypothetical protein
MNPDHDTARNLEHLHPDRIRIGTNGVFSGDWAWTTTSDGAMRIPVGFVGTLIDHFFLDHEDRRCIDLSDARSGHPYLHHRERQDGMTCVDRWMSFTVGGTVQCPAYS